MTRTGDDPLDIAAAHWVRMQSGEATDTERAAIERWCAQAPAHRAAMDAVSGGWDQAGLLDGHADLTAMIGAMHARHDGRGNGTWWRGGLLAASLAAFVMVPAGIWLLDRSGTDSVDLPVPKRQMAQNRGIRLVSPAGHRRDILLADGSRLLLDADSAVRFRFSKDRRELELERGRAFFAVYKDHARPFIVSTGQLTATAVGTAFDVSRFTDGGQVTTTEGVVRVVTQAATRDGGHATLVPAGMRLTQNVGSVSVRAVDVLRESAWRDGRIVFTAQCLSDVAAQMNRYGSGQLVISPQAARIAISGVFDIDNADGLAEALEQQGLVHVSRSADRIRLTPGVDVHGGDCSHAG
ncbi:FecR domain-containing protein [Sphingobium sp. CR2-8]|uniref:FecR family protein n=1 Tax=Sphingobium sp. CR2-8 TaxID=1306534 RepID=UPI002DBACFF0|nr:FecR domain-containing protein [Sphingobium sp. CR2-8]MEC3909405.1 FecR domain-containing protein [Sphingobium sp. CR2-8]